MLRTVRTLCALYTPSSTSTEYYFNPRLVTSGSTDFKPEKTNGLVSLEEFNELREKMIQGMGPDAKSAKTMHTVSIIALILYIVYWIAKIVLIATRIIRLTQNQSIALVVVVTIPFILLICYWRSCTTKAAGKVQTVLNKENHILGQRGLNWRIGPMLTWIRLSLPDANYQPPQAFYGQPNSGYLPQNYNMPPQQGHNQA